MRHFLLLFLTLCFSFYTYGQQTDSLFVRPGDGNWLLIHRIKEGETALSVARRYHVPPAMLAGQNDVSYQQQLTVGKKLYIPIGAYNFLRERPVNTSEAKPLYRRVDTDENLYTIARTSGVTRRLIQKWNDLYYSEIQPGQILLVGWVLFDPTGMNPPAVVKTKETPAPASSSAVSPPVVQSHPKPRYDTIFYKPTDTLVTYNDTLSEGERLFNQQTFDGSSVTDEKGTAAFFKRAGFSSNGIYFALHNTARRGTILKIYNPGSGKTIFAKVIGTLPQREIFHNAVVGISSDAKAVLEVPGQKMWCEISYAP